MNLSHFPFYDSIGLVIPKVCQNYSLRNGFINGLDLSVPQFRPTPFFRPLIIIYIYFEVGNLKREGGELLHVRPYGVCPHQLPKLALGLIDGIVRKESILKINSELLPSVDGEKAFFIFLTPFTSTIA